MFREMVDSGYFMYMAEAEGYDDLVDTRTAKINASIKDFKYIKEYGGNPNECIHEVLAEHGLSENLLTDAECERIMNEVNGY